MFQRKDYKQEEIHTIPTEKTINTCIRRKRNKQEKSKVAHYESTSEQILCKYQHKLLPHDKIGELAVKLAKEAYFGEAVMKRCTVMGHGQAWITH